MVAWPGCAADNRLSINFNTALSAYPLAVSATYGQGTFSVLAIPDDFADLYRLPQGVLNQIRALVGRDLFVSLDAPDHVSLFAYDNHTFIVQKLTQTVPPAPTPTLSPLFRLGDCRRRDDRGHAGFTLDPRWALQRQGHGYKPHCGRGSSGTGERHWGLACRHSKSDSARSSTETHPAIPNSTMLRSKAVNTRSPYWFRFIIISCAFQTPCCSGPSQTLPVCGNRGKTAPSRHEAERRLCCKFFIREFCRESLRDTLLSSRSNIMSFCSF